jgi:hypothetical protein
LHDLAVVELQGMAKGASAAAARRLKATFPQNAATALCGAAEGKVSALTGGITPAAAGRAAATNTPAPVRRMRRQNWRLAIMVASRWA